MATNSPLPMLRLMSSSTEVPPKDLLTLFSSRKAIKIHASRQGREGFFREWALCPSRRLHQDLLEQSLRQAQADSLCQPLHLPKTNCPKSSSTRLSRFTPKPARDCSKPFTRCFSRTN